MVVRITFFSRRDYRPLNTLSIDVNELELFNYGGQGQIYTWLYQGKKYVVKVILNDDSVLRRLRDMKQAIEETAKEIKQKVPDNILERAFPVAQGGGDPEDFGFDKNDKAFVIVYNWVEGVTINKYLEKEPPLSQRRKEAAKQILEILALLERAGIINNDLYPDNFIANTSSGRIYMIDLEGAGLLDLKKRVWIWEPKVLKKDYPGYCDPPEYVSKADEQWIFSYRWIGAILLFEILFGNPFQFLSIIDYPTLLDMYQKVDKENIAWPPYGSEKINNLNPRLNPNIFRDLIRKKSQIRSEKCSPLEKLAFLSFIYGFKEIARRPSFEFMKLLLNEVLEI
jgi:serine/threonine protein kinase